MRPHEDCRRGERGKYGGREEAPMERDDRDMQAGNDDANTERPADGPSREDGEDRDPGATSQDQPGGDA